MWEKCNYCKCYKVCNEVYTYCESSDLPGFEPVNIFKRFAIKIALNRHRRIIKRLYGINYK